MTLFFEMFQEIPSKENGIDMEGIAIDDNEKLHIGFRGPVVRGNFVPILVLSFEGKFKEKNMQSEILFVNLGGRGIRGLDTIQEGFLLLAGPNGDEEISTQLYFWNGKDCIPGKDNSNALNNVNLLCTIPIPTAGAKPEGLHVIKEDSEQFQFMIVFDGVENGDPTIFSCDR